MPVIPEPCGVSLPSFGRDQAFELAIFAATRRAARRLDAIEIAACPGEITLRDVKRTGVAQGRDVIWIGGQRLGVPVPRLVEIAVLPASYFPERMRARAAPKLACCCAADAVGWTAAGGAGCGWTVAAGSGGGAGCAVAGGDTGFCAGAARCFSSSLRLGFGSAVRSLRTAGFSGPASGFRLQKPPMPLTDAMHCS